MKRALLIAAAVLVVLVVGLGGAVGSAFMGLQPVKDGATLAGGVTQVQDGYVTAFIVPAGEGQAVLIDCGQDPEAKALKAALDARTGQSPPSSSRTATATTSAGATRSPARPSTPSRAIARSWRAPRRRTAR